MVQGLCWELISSYSQEILGFEECILAFDVLMAITIYCVTPHGLVYQYHGFPEDGGSGSCDVLVPTYQTMWLHIPEGCIVENCGHRSLPLDLVIKRFFPAQLHALFSCSRWFVSRSPKRFSCMRFPYIFHFCYLCYIPTSYHLADLIPIAILGEEYKSWICWLYSFSYCLVTSFHVDPEILLIDLYSDISVYILFECVIKF